MRKKHSSFFKFVVSILLIVSMLLIVICIDSDFSNYYLLIRNNDYSDGLLFDGLKPVSDGNINGSEGTASVSYDGLNYDCLLYTSDAADD